MTINQELFQWLHAGAGTRPLIDNLAIFWAEGGPFILAVIFVGLWFIAGRDKKIAMLEATEAAGLGLIINQIVGFFYFHPRPFMIGLCTPLLPHVAENSFPSDHATLMFSAALYLLLCRGWLSCGLTILAAALFTAWGRVYVGIHFPFDMAGSFLIALAAAGLMAFAYDCGRTAAAGYLATLNSKIYQIIEIIIRPISRRIHHE